MKVGYSQDRAWSDQHLTQVRNIVGPLLLMPAGDFEDMKECTDLIVLKARDMRIGVRLRRSKFLGRYKDEITLRYKRDSGQKTEFEKIKEGFGDWFFYGKTQESEIAEWVLIDLHKFRDQISTDSFRALKGKAWGKNSNKDGTHFIFFNVKFLNCTIASSDN